MLLNHFGAALPCVRSSVLTSDLVAMYTFLLVVCRQEPLLWECVRGNILASLFMLARIWDLAFFLDNHALVSFIYEQYALQRALLRQPVLTPEPTQEDDFEDMDEEVMSLMAKVKSREDRQWVDLRCTRCDRRIQTVSLACLFLQSPLPHAK